MIRGSVDVVTTKLVSGWIYSNGQKEPLSVEAAINGGILGRATANLPRPDLAAAGFGEGKCGFELNFERPLDPLYIPFVQVLMAGTDLQLRRWAGAGYRDYFQALHAKHPRAGRSASVFGGLWTDRSDAAAILRGRTDVGSVDRRDANKVARYIHEGFLVIAVSEKKDTTAIKSGGSDFAAAAAAVMFDDGLLRLLRAILDDNPVAVRADSLNPSDQVFRQISALEELPSPAECLGMVITRGEKPTVVEIVREGHRIPEFLPNGMSRWTHEASEMSDRLALGPDVPIDRQIIPTGSVLITSPGALWRPSAVPNNGIKMLILPSRLSLLRFHAKPPRGEMAHPSGARIWI